MTNDHRIRSFEKKNTHTHNNNTETHTSYQTTTGGGRWDKKNTHTYINIHNNPQKRIHHGKRQPGAVVGWGGHTHTHATTQHTRIHHGKRPPDVVVGTKNTHTQTHTHIQ